MRIAESRSAASLEIGQLEASGQPSPSNCSADRLVDGIGTQCSAKPIDQKGGGRRTTLSGVGQLAVQKNGLGRLCDLPAAASPDRGSGQIHITDLRIDQASDGQTGAVDQQNRQPVGRMRGAGEEAAELPGRDRLRGPGAWCEIHHP